MTDAAPLTNRLGSKSTRTGLPAREVGKVTTTRGTDELLARAREAESEEGRVDHSTLSTLHDRLQDV